MNYFNLNNNGNLFISKFFLCLSLFRLVDLTTRNRRELELETERIRTSQLQAEKQLESREKAHRLRIKGLEEQVKFFLFILFFIRKLF